VSPNPIPKPCARFGSVNETRVQFLFRKYLVASRESRFVFLRACWIRNGWCREIAHFVSAHAALVLPSTCKSNPVLGSSASTFKAALLPLLGEMLGGQTFVRLHLQLLMRARWGWSPASKTVLSRDSYAPLNMRPMFPTPTITPNAVASPCSVIPSASFMSTILIFVRQS